MEAQTELTLPESVFGEFVADATREGSIASKDALDTLTQSCKSAVEAAAKAASARHSVGRAEATMAESVASIGSDGEAARARPAHHHVHRNSVSSAELTSVHRALWGQLHKGLRRVSVWRGA